MDITVVEGTLALAFGLGLLHALDADHIMAVSGLASRKPSFRSCLTFCRHWAIGHGVALMLIALVVFGFSAAIPEGLSHLAESMVGLVLVVIGVWTFWDMARRKIKFGFHRHQPDIEHAHWLEVKKNNNHNHSAVLVGLLHGTAGSAPLLLLIPLSKFGSLSHAISYVLLFSFGVIVSMLIFGGLMGKLYQSLEHFGGRAITIVRSMVALSSIGFGAHLLAGYL